MKENELARPSMVGTETLPSAPVLIAGPCSAETREQVLETAQALAQAGISYFRAGIWKPRTSPGSFEGVGTEGLAWLQEVKAQFGLKVTTEVANAKHVEEALAHGVDMLWIGARTTVNPFAVQEIADALAGVQVPVMVKNPVNPDLGLWIGAMERIQRAGIDQLMACHRGFNVYGKSRFRNTPLWEIPIELKRQWPDLPLICDPSHITGKRELIEEIARKALDLGYEGLMVETHPNPADAWSDARQQVTPEVYRQIMGRINFRRKHSDDLLFKTRIHHLRDEIDEIDTRLIELLAERMEIARTIGQLKKENNVAFFQQNRWNEVVQSCKQDAARLKLNEDLVLRLFSLIHLESIDIQGE
jgi:chorismate mutase